MQLEIEKIGGSKGADQHYLYYNSIIVITAVFRVKSRTDLAI